MKSGQNQPCPCGSGRKYKKCCLRADSRPHSEETVDDESFPPPANYEVLRDFLRRFRRTDVLKELGQLGALQAANQGDVEILKRVQPWNLSFLARIAIVHSNDDRHATLDNRSVQQMLNLCARYDDPIVTGRSSPQSYFIRTAYLQFPVQESTITLIPRALALFTVLPRDFRARTEFDFEAAALRIYGMSLQEFMLVGTALYMLAIARKGVIPASILLAQVQSARLGAGFTQEKIDRALALIACSYQEFEHLAASFSFRAGFEQFAYNPIYERPALWSADEEGVLIVPSPLYLLRRISYSVYYDVMNDLDEAGAKTFGGWFGELVQEYVKRLLVPTLPGLMTEEQFKHKDRAIESAPDFAIRIGNRGATLECKSSRPLLALRTFANDSDLETLFPREFLKGCIQLRNTLDSVEGQKSGFEPLIGVEHLHPILITLDPFYLFETSMVRPVVDGLMERKGHDPLPYSVISVNDLEQLASHFSPIKLLDALDAYSTLPPDNRNFRQLFLDKYASGPPQMPQWLERIKDDFFEELKPTAGR